MSYKENMERACRSFWQYIDTLNMKEQEHEKIEGLLCHVIESSLLFGFTEGLKKRREREYSK